MLIRTFLLVVTDWIVEGFEAGHGGREKESGFEPSLEHKQNAAGL
jgi:hypothetical protein